MGYYSMDIAVTESEFEDYDSADELIAAFRVGYQNYYNCFPDRQNVKIFGVLGSLLFLEWVFESENDRVRQDKIKWLPETIKSIKETV